MSSGYIVYFLRAHPGRTEQQQLPEEGRILSLSLCRKTGTQQSKNFKAENSRDSTPLMTTLEDGPPSTLISGMTPFSLSLLMLLSHVYTLSRFSRLRLFVTPWTVARHAPPSVEFSRQEYWSTGCHFLHQGIVPTQESNPRLLCLLHGQADSLPLAPSGKPCFCYKSC